MIWGPGGCEVEIGEDERNDKRLIYAIMAERAGGESLMNYPIWARQGTQAGSTRQPHIHARTGILAFANRIDRQNNVGIMCAMDAASIYVKISATLACGHPKTTTRLKDKGTDISTNLQNHPRYLDYLEYPDAPGEKGRPTLGPTPAMAFASIGRFA
ncbi:hypothetical protein CLAIMM_13663 [Cladophialophora immunda]|nr:hypothetical protein CLAIMM_13663 [Cladophialophora immunda]